MEKFLHTFLSISIVFSILLVVLGNEPLNSTYIMEAKKRFMSIDPTKLPDPPMPSYTFTIYNRDLFEKSKFKDYDSLLESRTARCQARANYLASILKNGSAIGANETLTRPQDVQESRAREKVPKTTSTHFINGGYVISFTLGTEQIKNYLLLDTGSDLVWWQCGPCKANKCYKQKTPLYVSTNSKTYRKLDCIVKSESCSIELPNYECTPFGNQCLYDVNYGDGERTKGCIADDVISFVLDQNPVRIVFGCGKDQTSGTHFSGEYSGIAGIGRRRMSGGYSLSSQFEADIMSMCLPRFFSEKGSTISFHTTPFKKTSAELLPNFGYPNFYFVNLYKVFINDKEIPLYPSLWNFKNDMMGGIIVDTGTTYSRFPQDFYTEFRYIFKQEVRDIPMDAPAGAFDTCYRADPSAEFPVVKLYFGRQDPNNLLLLAQDRVVVHIRGKYCLAFLGWHRSLAILGSNQLQGVGLTFDTSANTLSFDLDACD
ncbi:protein ASPARTIC PROTEASE IN GUARD CELL 1-like [Lycium barbarum]|uniref:protein ASPARTIC PROTEASE IN GUARD CELL 1-like n=1 Tax=Lycium barbarum TaxID=112863 RepID=UPI00293F0F91|nr:protein ASPARTIC PROTEASE IN GUARD CELL 1-like [Lycium barbarum]